MARKPVNPTLIPNTTMEKYINSSGRFIAYYIYPVEGYVLHDNAGAWTDPNTGVGYEAYFTGYCTAGATYDFATSTTVDGYTAYGSRKFFARPANEVPGDQIFGGVNNDHEVM